MAHYARVENTIVKEVIVAEQDFIDNMVANAAGEWIQVSYNTRAGVHYDPETGLPSDDQTKALRKNYPSVDWNYSIDADAFYPPQPYSSWTLNETTYLWEAPLTYPTDGLVYEWDEDAYQADNTTGWVEVTND